MSKGWTARDMGDLTGKTAVITGASSGLGLHCSRALAAAGARVIMACRNLDKGAEVLEAIQAELPDAALELQALDLADLGSVAVCARTLAERDVGIDMLINNAGVMAVPLSRTADGFEMQIGTNHLGHFALTSHLLPLLRAGARIVTVSSQAHRLTPGIDFDDLNWEGRRYKAWQAYGDSKLANLLFHYELHRRLTQAGRNCTAVAAHPGYAATHLQFVAAEQKQSRVEAMFMHVGNTLLAQSGQMGALPSLYAATAPAVASGDFIGPNGIQQMRGYPTTVQSRRMAQDPERAHRLWDRSQTLTGVNFAIED